jgi:hypothetical protein
MSAHAAMRGWTIAFVKGKIAVNQKALVASAWRASATVCEYESQRRRFTLEMRVYRKSDGEYCQVEPDNYYNGCQSSDYELDLPARLPFWSSSVVGEPRLSIAVALSSV